MSALLKALDTSANFLPDGFNLGMADLEGYTRFLWERDVTLVCALLSDQVKAADQGLTFSDDGHSKRSASMGSSRDAFLAG
jgi:hypothetical protein